jgi:hypothetical protein
VRELEALCRWTKEICGEQGYVFFSFLCWWKKGVGKERVWANVCCRFEGLDGVEFEDIDER